MIVSERLRAARKACKMTQSQVADILGIDRSAYTYYETGKSSPSYENLMRLAAMFKVDVQWFLFADETDLCLHSGDDVFTLMNAVNESGMLQLSNEERQLVAFFRAMTAEGKGDAVMDALKQVRDREAAPAENEAGDAQ